MSGYLSWTRRGGGAQATERHCSAAPRALCPLFRAVNGSPELWGITTGGLTMSKLAVLLIAAALLALQGYTLSEVAKQGRQIAAQQEQIEQLQDDIVRLYFPEGDR